MTRLRGVVIYRSAEALRHPKARLRGAEAPLFHGRAGLVVCLKACPDTSLQRSTFKVNVGAAGVRGSHPFAENAKGWGTLFGFGAGSVKITINVEGERGSRLLPHVASSRVFPLWKTLRNNWRDDLDFD